jgi:flagellar basal body-associated protein FliL
MNKKKNIWIHIAIIVLMAVVACVYFSPALSGMVVSQGDMQKAEAMAYEQKQVKDQTGTMPNWTSSMFSGMPGYQIAASTPKTVFTPLKSILIGRPLGIERNIGILFLYLLGFYVALLAFGVNPWLALAGALAFGLGSYNIIIVEAGHITKAWAISMMAPIFAGMVMVFRAPQSKRPKSQYLWGGILFALALGLQITFNHIQITYYTIIGAVLLGLVYLVYSIKDKYFPKFLTGVALLVVGCIFAFGCNARLLLVNQEYGKYTMRGGSEITVTPEDLYHDGEAKNAETSATGLNIDYAYSWSYGVGETYTLLVPGAKGGGSGEKVGENSECYKAFHQDRAPLYWGDQPFTSGPVYFGAIICFLFVLGLFVVKGPERWWLFLATLLAILMSWGKNLLGFNQFLFDNLPLYNKFRTPSMSLVLANVTMALMAILTLKELLQKPADGTDLGKLNKDRIKGLYWATGITGGLILLVMMFHNSFTFSGVADQQMSAQYGAQWPQLQDIFIKDRKSLLMHDSWRSLFYVLASAFVLWLVMNGKMKKKGWPITIIGLLMLFDLWGVDRRYLSEENFVEPRRVALYPDQYDMQIDQSAAQYGDKDYRVFNLAVNTFNDSKPSAFHHQIGGYSAAKLRRYQDIIDFYLSRHINVNVLNMLNTRYFVVPDQQSGAPMVQRNVAALGNAWFVDTVKMVKDANEEIMALNTINPANVAVADASLWAKQLQGKQFVKDSGASINMEHQQPYNPDYLKYTTHSATQQLAVFSEIYYRPDWFAYIDGKPAEYMRVNYILRAMVVPAGDHVIEFRNEAPRLHKLDSVTVIFSIAFVIVVIGAIVLYYTIGKKDEEPEPEKPASNNEPAKAKKRK